MLAGALILLLGGFTATTLAQDRYGHPPNNAFQVRLGYFLPDGGGTLWDDVEDRFTLGVDDFNAGVWGLSFVSALNNHVELGVNADWYQRTVRSEERDYIDQDGFPIVHDTTLRQVPLAVDLRLLPGGRYRAHRGGALAKPVFYLGAGVGVNIWEYEEVGDFVDEGDPALPIYFGAFKESGESLEARVLAGLEFPVSRSFNLTFEGRYTFAETDSPDSIDRGGAWMFAGASFRF